MSKNARDSTSDNSLYQQMGVSFTKKDVHSALKKTKIEELFPGSFCKVVPDISKDPDYAIIQHQDGAGSKVLQAYIHYKETGNPNWFRANVHDTIAMNLDDILCVGITEPVVFTDTIDRNPDTVPGEVLEVIIDEFKKACDTLNKNNVPILFAGGETADLGDQVKTLTLNGAATVRFRRNDVITGQKIEPGDVIIGISSAGRASYETLSAKENSGMGSNGLTLARHALMHSEYREKYPETIEERKIKKGLAYFGPYKYDDYQEDLGMTVGEAILSPTRTNAPIIHEILGKQRKNITGIVHNTGGGQAKCLHLGKNIHYIKDNLFEMNPIFKLIQKTSKENWKNMYNTFNSGNRLEVICKPEAERDVVKTASKYGIKARQIGCCEKTSGANKLTVKSEYGEFRWQKD